MLVSRINTIQAHFHCRIQMAVGWICCLIADGLHGGAAMNSFDVGTQGCTDKLEIVMIFAEHRTKLRPQQLSKRLVGAEGRLCCCIDP